MSFSEEISLKNEVSSEIIESIAEEDYNKNEDVFEVYLNEYYNEKDQPLVRSILKEMGYEFLCFLFEKEKIDLESFQNLNTNFIMTLLNQYPIGFIVKFNQAYEKWKFEHEMNVNSCILQKLDLLSIHSILRESAQGKKFLATIDHDQPMSSIERNELISIIVSSILNKRNNISKNEIRNLALMIISEFPNEDISSYINETTGCENRSCKIYRALERPDGYMLISIDFNTLHPVHLNFYTEWNKYQEQIYAKLESNEAAKNKFHLLSTNQKAIKTLISISDFLYGPPALKGSDKSRYRASKLDALKFLLFRCLSENLFQLNISEWQQHLSQYSITMQAFIFLFGESFENLEDKFLVCLDDIIYTFEGEVALISAIDTLFKNLPCL
ncbi:hypothetical protein PVAND_006145 [Polypedilum vanderplanki]|uniref:Uncharacterized protein n=1 Tax=Polypedilum vanderplanki TaxID=319348 RepID=A0A9J6C2P8_POLVA|nr:hypothetical protein PVAND_006145 [Polypedilum vanderplanki]